jgi:hypothetical protein
LYNTAGRDAIASPKERSVFAKWKFIGASVSIVIVALLITGTLSFHGRKADVAEDFTNWASEKTPPEYIKSHYLRRSNYPTVVVFINSVLGNAYSTWRNPRTNAFWPTLVAEDPIFRNTDIYVNSYPSSSTDPPPLSTNYLIS